jgi:D-galactarolactone isomerase
VLQRLPCRLVIDHTGKFLEPVGVDHPGFQALLQLLNGGNCWVKLSAPYETSKTGAPEYADVSLLARTLALRFPDRCLWASNWPHPNRNPVPSDAEMLGLLTAWAPSAEAREKILVTNPAEIYGFSS